MPEGREAAKEQVLKTTRDGNIKLISLWFTDILGFLKSLDITPRELETVLGHGAGFDGSSIEGFARIDESDMVAFPDPATFQVLPWSLPQHPVARMFCDVLKPGGEAFEGDPRYILKRNLQRATDQGYTFNVGPELEYFYFKNAEGTDTLDEGGYFDLTPPDIASDLRLETILALEQMGITVQSSHHEVATSQHEIDLLYTDALTIADSIMTSRLVIKEIAQKHGIYATFMPKPILGVNGSGMHVHQSLFKNGRNAFFDENPPYLSKVARHYTAGLLKHAPEITSIVSQWVNSYKRLVPGYEAPVYLSWARRNRSDMIRVPEYQPGQENATRIEFRVPDPAGNPYLVFSVMLAAGLEGIEKEYELGDPIENNIFQMTDQEREERGIGHLPRNLSEAISITENSALVKKALGDHLFNSFIENKKIEWNLYRIQVTEYELKRYLPIL
ncbi:MAG: glutamine synthetase [Dehalococcoidales bacterium]|nr:MAG: glutamine synthetase [Dehalococcoidales bacterium]